MQNALARLRASSFGQGLRSAVNRAGPKILTRRTVKTYVKPSSAVASLSALPDNGRRVHENAALAAALLSSAFGLGYMATHCDAGHKNHDDLTPAHVAKENFQDVVSSHDVDSMPIYTLEEVAKNNGENGRPIWMTYGGVVYDTTDFIANHPGGSEKIMMAAGSAIEPYWYTYRQHFASDLPMRLMEHMAIGRLSEEEQEMIDDQMAVLEEDDPYAKEPFRHRSLIMHGDTPCNAEVPSNLLTKSYLTPASIFYIRHHHPVPFMSDLDKANFRLKVDLTEYGKGVKSFSLDELKAMKKTEIIATLQCSGNRRSGFNAHERTSGTPWGQGAISTAKFGGVLLKDVLKVAGLDDPIEAEEKRGIEHVRFHALDGMQASIGIEKACNPYGDVLVAYEMNDEPMPRDHGYPLRMVVPGYAAVRNVKWVEKIEVSKTEAEGAWQRGLNYKTLPPNMTDAKNVDLEKMPSMMEASIFSGITKIERLTEGKPKLGDSIPLKVSGWAWAGGGRNIVRVDVSADDGKTWASAKLLEGSDQRYGRAWAWVFWECDVEGVVDEDGKVQLSSKAVDMAFNSQPQNANHGWNVRGLSNNSWYRKQVSALE
eukprot:scaffold766_cov179-Amphora_coffeaeformis.AAC.8